MSDLGPGRLGPVYLAINAEGDTTAAIRVIDQYFAEASQDNLLQALSALCGAPLDHPSIAVPLESGVAEGKPYVAHVYVDGDPLDELIATRGPQLLIDVLPRLTQAAAGLDFAAAAGVHHGLLVPRDIIFGPDRAIVVGLGLAEALRQAGSDVAAIAPYASPQRLRGAGPSASDDVYSFAAIVFELLVGHAPARGEIDRSLVALDFVDAGAHGALFQSALSDSAEERPATALGFVAALQRGIAPQQVEDLPLYVTAHPETEFEPEYSLHRTDSESPLSLLIAPADVVSQAPPVMDPKPEAREAVAPPVEPTRWASDRSVIVGSEVIEASPGTGSEPQNARRSVSLVLGAVVVALVIGFAAGFVAGRRGLPVLSAAFPGVGNSPSSARPTGASARAPDARPFTESAVESSQLPAPVAPAAVGATPPAGERAQSAARPPSAPGAGVLTVGPGDSGRVLVRSTPAGANVLVNGTPRGVTPLALRQLPFGDHLVSVREPGYESQQQEVTLTPDRPAQSVDFELRPTDRAASTSAGGGEGALQIDSRPGPAQVFLDEALVGSTPLLVPNLQPGAHTLRIELPGYRSWSTRVTIEPGARTRVAASLER